MTSPLFRSPTFWAGVGIVAVGVGVALHRKRSQLLGRHPGPTPFLVTPNTARTPKPVSTNTVGGVTVSRYEAPSISIDERMKLVQARAWQGVHDPRIRRLAGQITKSCGRDEGDCEIQRVYEWVRKNIRYSGDIGPIKNPGTGVVEPIDLYQSPYRTADMQIGDCDDHVSLVGSLLAVMGHTVRLRVTAPSRLGDWAHVYLVVGVNSKTEPTKWRAVDTTLPGRATAGTEVKYAKGRDYLLEAPI